MKLSWAPAETTGRVCFGIDLNLAYVDVATATLAETGESFADLKAERSAS